MSGIPELPSANIVAVEEHFDTLATTGGWSNLYAVNNGKTYHFHVRRQRVLELLPPTLGDVADIGCGPGIMVEPVLARGGRFEGIDLSPEMIRAARQQYRETDRVRFRIGNAENLQIPNGSVDQVICMAVIEYLKTPDRVLSEIARILRPGGIAIITVPKRWHIDRLTVGATAPVRALARMAGIQGADSLPRLCLQPNELDAAADKAGLKVTGAASYYFTPAPYPLTRIAPEWTRRVNVKMERLYRTHSPLAGFLAHGYIGRYEKP